MSSATLAGERNSFNPAAGAGAQPPDMEESPRVKFNRSWVEGAYYDPRDPAEVKAPFLLENNHRLRINDPTHPHHKTPAPNPKPKNRNLLALKKYRKERYEKFLEYMIKSKISFWMPHLVSRLEISNPGGNNEIIAWKLFDNWLAQMSTSVDEYHLDLYERVRKSEDPIQFSLAILNEILSQHIQTEANNSEVYEPGRLLSRKKWKQNLMRELNATREQREESVRGRKVEGVEAEGQEVEGVGVKKVEAEGGRRKAKARKTRRKTKGRKQTRKN